MRTASITEEGHKAIGEEILVEDLAARKSIMVAKVWPFVELMT